MRRVELRRRALLAIAVSALASCSLAPKLELPAVPVADTYKEPAPWIQAAPADRLPRDAWWQPFGDEDLNRLQAQLLQNSPDLQAAFARYYQARAFADQLRSGLFPSFALRADGSRARQSETNPPAGAASPRYYD